MLDLPRAHDSFREALERRLARMSAKRGFRRLLLDAVYGEGARWTGHTALGLFVVMPLQLLGYATFAVCSLSVLPVMSLAWSVLLLADRVARSFSDMAYRRYRSVLEQYKDLVISGKEP